MPDEVAGNGLRLEPGKDVGISKERKRYTDMEKNCKSTE
jgi:hypothetical protein